MRYIMVKILRACIRLHDGFWRHVRNFYYRHAFNRCGPELQIDKGVVIVNPQRISLGKHVILNKGAILQGTEDGSISVGDNVTLSYSAKILTANFDLQSRQHIYANVVVGNNVWIAANAVVLPGVVIGDNVLVAAGAVVVDNLDSGFVYGGVPAKRIKELKDDSLSD